MNTMKYASTEYLWDHLKRVEDYGKQVRAALDAGKGDPKVLQQALFDTRDKWKAIKREIDSRSSQHGLAPAAVAAAPAPAQISPKDFHRDLASHDWTHSYSDDPRVYRSGSANEYRLREISGRQPELAPLFDQWQAHALRGGPRPPEPQE